MSYFDEEYDYDTLANDTDYIDEYDQYEDDYTNTDLETWENYYHSIVDDADDIDE